MNMTQLITKSADWKEVNKHILLAFVKGFYYLDKEEGKVVYIPSYRVGLEHHTFSNELYEDPNGELTFAIRQDICLVAIQVHDRYYFKIEEENITWSLDKGVMDAILQEQNTILYNPDEKVDID